MQPGLDLWVSEDWCNEICIIGRPPRPQTSQQKNFSSKPLNETDLNQCIHDKNLSQSHGKGFKKCKKKGRESIVYKVGAGGTVSGKRESAHKKCRRSLQRHEHRAGRGLAGCGRARATTAPHDAAEAQAGVCSDSDSEESETGSDGECGPATMIL